MEKNYNYNYENRSQGQKLPIGYSNLGVSSCTSEVLDKSPVTNGSLWHTTDKNEFYYDWNGSRIKLNLTGDNASISAELEKIKEEIKNLDPDAVKDIVKELETKVNSAVSTVNTLKITVESAAQDAKDAAAQVKNKADVSYVDNKIAGKVDVSVVTTLQNTVSDLETSISNKANASDVTALSQAISNKADSSKVETLAQSVTSLSDAVSNKVDASVVTALDAKVDGFQTVIDAKPDMTAVESAITSAIANKADKSDLNGKVSQDEFDTLKGAVDAIQIPTKVSEFENDKKYITRLEIESDFLTTEDRAALDAIKDLGASDVTTGEFPVVNPDTPTDPTEAALDGLATVQDVMNYVNALIEKKKGELGPVEPGIPYLYTNGYRVGDTAIGLTDTLNRYEIVLNENNEFEIELLHKNEEDGYYDTEDPTGSYYGTYFKVIVPNGYTVKTYLWDDTANPPAYKSDDTSVTDPAYSLIAEDVTPDNTTYYYKDVVDRFLFSGAKIAIEDDIQQSYDGHLIKLVLKK